MIVRGNRGTAPGKRWALLITVASLGLVGVPPGLPSRSQAQEGPATKMKELNRQALADYAAEDYVSAQLGLREAVAVGQRAGLARDPLMARMYANLGAVYFNGLKDVRRATRALQAALAIDPEIKLVDVLSTPELRETFAQLQAQARPPGSGNAAEAAAPAPAPKPEAPAAAPPLPPAAAAGSEPPKPAPAEKKPAPEPPKLAAVASGKRRVVNEEPDLPARIPQPLYCPTPDEAPPGEHITLNCVLAPDVSAQKVTLFYRPPGAPGFVSAGTTRSSKGWYRGVIPGDVVQGRSLQFYLEARDSTNEVVGRVGRDDSPNVVLIREGAVPAGTGLFAGVRFRRQGELEQGAGEEDPLQAIARDRERELAAQGVRRRREGAIYVAVGLGSGYGYHDKQRLEFYRDAEIEKGWIPSGILHLAPEIGYQVTDHFAVSLLGRLQVISQSGSGDMRLGNPARGAYAVLARPQLLIGARNLQLDLSGYAGGGDGFRLTIPPQLPKFRRNDSVRGGPLVIGAGVGALFHLSPHLALALDGRWLLGYPDFATVADAATGLQLAF